MPGDLYGNYELITELGPIGKGASGVVWRAKHQHLESPVAVKILHRALAADAEARRRFLNEAKAAVGAAHDHVVKVIDYGVTDGGECYLVMELLVGETLAERLSRGALDELTAIDMSIAIADAISVAHVRGILHRDLKPANLFVTADGVKILDFGVAKLVAASQRTPAGNVVGTLKYIAPELCRGTEDSSAQSDLYSFGCVLYEMVAGQPPFPIKEPALLVAAHLFDKPAPPSQFARLLPELELLILDCLAKDPKARPPSMAALRQRLSALQEELRFPGAASRRRRSEMRWLVAWAAVVVALAGAGFWLARHW